MQLSLVLITFFSVAVVSQVQAEKRPAARRLAAAMLANPMPMPTMMPLMARTPSSSSSSCDTGYRECSNQDGCCPKDADCVGDGTCDVECGVLDNMCDDNTCCEIGYKCAAESGDPCIKTSHHTTTHHSSHHHTSTYDDDDDDDSYTSYDSYTDTYTYDSYTDTYTTYDSSTTTSPDSFAFATSSTDFLGPTGAAHRNALANMGALPLAGVVMALV